jgi:putative MATE family efflux protein
MTSDPPDGPLPGSDEHLEEAHLPEAPAAIPAAALAAHSGPALHDRRHTDQEIWAMIGRLGTEPLAAVGYATQFLFLAQSILFSVGIACVALMARAIGAGRPDRARAALGASLILAFWASVVVAGLVIIAPAPLLALLDAHPDVIHLAVPYFRLTLGSSVFFSISIVIESALRAAKDTRTPMWIAGGVMVLKIALNFLLIFGLFGFPRLELVGAGLATLISQALAVVVFVYASRYHRESAALRVGWKDRAAVRAALPEVIRISVPAIIERALMNFALMAYFAFLGQYGSAAIAAYTIGVRVLAFSWIPGVGFSAAASTLVGQALGAEDVSGARRAGWRATRHSVLVSLVLGAVYVLARTPLARAFTSDPLVIEQLEPFMLILALAQPLLGLHFTLGGALRGAGDTVTPLLAGALGNWVFRVPLAFLAARVFGLDVIYVWLALFFDHLGRSVWLILAFKRERWVTAIGAGPRRAA